METVVLLVRSLENTLAKAARTMKGARSDHVARIRFDSPKLLWLVLTAKRRVRLKALYGAGPVSIHEAARRVHLDLKAVHRDAAAPVNAGVLTRADEGEVEFSFQPVKVASILQAA